MRYRHVALLIGDDLRRAEEYYAGLFAMEVVLREGLAGAGSGEWGQLPPDRTWDDAAAAGVDIAMVALQRGDVILPLFKAPPTGERIYALEGQWIGPRGNHLVACPKPSSDFGPRPIH